MKFIFHTDKFVIQPNNYKASVLPLAKGFGLVTPDPISSHELGWSGHETICLSKVRVIAETRPVQFLRAVKILVRRSC